MDDGANAGIPNVEVQLFKAGDDPSVATPVMTTTTNISGTYLFENVMSGMSYFVSIKTSQPALAIFDASSPGGGHDPLISDEDYNVGGGYGDDGVIVDFGGMSYAVTQVFTPTHGGQDVVLQGEDANAPGWDDADDFLVVDFGFINDASPSSLTLQSNSLSAQSDNIWFVWVILASILSLVTVTFVSRTGKQDTV
jgi:hypothetical protein